MTPSAPSPGAAFDLRRRAEAAGAAALPPLLIAAERLAQTARLGAHGRRQAGTGDEFWQYRMARPGDSARFIDWRRSARSDAQYIREREGQAAQALCFWVDEGASMRFTGAPSRPAKGDRARLLALALAVLAARAGERVGRLAPDAAPARAGRAQLLALALALTSPDPEAGTAAINANARETAPAIPLNAAPRGAQLVLFSDFLADPAPIEATLAAAAARGLRGALFQILDPEEEDFPFSGRTIFESMSGGLRFETREAADLRARYLDRLAARRDRLARAAGSAGWLIGTHRTDAPPQAALGWLHAALGRDLG